MRYTIFLLQIICFLLFTNVVKAQEKDIISVYKTEMEKEKIFVKEIEKSITSDTLFYPFGKESVLTSLTVNGNLKSFSKKSFLRITLIDSDGVEYLVFESNYMTRDSPDFHFQEEFEETGVLDYITPVCVCIKITSSELNNLKLNYTERLEDKDKKISNIKLDIIKFRKNER